MYLQPKPLPFEHGGKTYQLYVNMNVLADLQELHGGTIDPLLSRKRTMKNIFETVAAAMNEYAYDQGWPERFTSHDVGKMMTAKRFGEIADRIIEMIFQAVYEPDTERPDEAQPTENQSEESGEKKEQTTQPNPTASDSRGT